MRNTMENTIRALVATEAAPKVYELEGSSVNIANFIFHNKNVRKIIFYDTKGIFIISYHNGTIEKYTDFDFALEVSKNLLGISFGFETPTQLVARVIN